MLPALHDGSYYLRASAFPFPVSCAANNRQSQTGARCHSSKAKSTTEMLVPGYVRPASLNLAGHSSQSAYQACQQNKLTTWVVTLLPAVILVQTSCAAITTAAGDFSGGNSCTVTATALCCTPPTR